MSATTIRNKLVNIRKPHRCELCNEKTHPPAKMYSWAVACDGEVQDGYYCEPCNAFMATGVADELIQDECHFCAQDFEEYPAFKEQFLKQQASRHEDPQHD